MTSKWCLLLLGFGAHGCSTPCEENCGAQSDCPGAIQVDCSATCADAEAIADNASCRTQLDAATQCELAAPDACASHDTCSDAIKAYTDCFDAACIDKPSICGFGGSGPSTGGSGA